MKFRTQLDIRRSALQLGMTTPLISVGSCFSRAIGQRLADGGVDICVTPMGILFNPLSIGSVLLRAMRGKQFAASDLYCDSAGIYHALAFESRRQSDKPDMLLDELNADFARYSRSLKDAGCLLVTFGTAWCFHHIPTDSLVGNCHKLPDIEFCRRLCSVEEIVETWRPIVESGRRIIFTVSPVRHLNDGLYGNTLSKARLHLAIEALCDEYDNVEYFPAYEALVDDLRDYRFYADDMKHPSPIAEEYIFEIFAETYYSRVDREAIADGRRRSRHLLHRSILG